jgi:hypothetical protein
MSSADIKTTSTLDLSGLGRAITAAERKVLRQFQSDALLLIRNRWQGWRYAGRPSNAPRNVSQSAWKAKTQAFDVAAVGVVISNEARAWDTKQSYVAQVERRAGAGSEAVKVLREVDDTLWPDAERALIMAINTALKPKPPRSLSGRTAGTYARTVAAGQVL